MNWAASHVETRRPLREVVQNGRKEGWGGEAISKKKNKELFLG